MPHIKPEEVQEIATLARLRLTDEETARMAGELDAILGHIDEIKALDTDAIEPMTHAVAFDCPMRADETAPSLTVEEALANAPRREASFFQVPRIISGKGDAGTSGAGEM